MKITFHILIYISITIFLNFTTGLVYASDHLDHQELTEVFEFCHTNQASDLCNLLGQEVLDYQNQPTYKDYDLSFNESISNYEHFAHAAFAVSVPAFPAFLKYLPALANLAKNNMIFASAALLIAGAVGFKTYYDSLYDNLILTDKSVKINSFDKSRIIELQSSKRYQHYSKKGPEHEERTLVPSVRKQNRKKHKRESEDNLSFLSYLKGLKDVINEKEKYPSSDNHPHLKKMTTELISSLENYKPPRSFHLRDVLELLTDEIVPGEISYVSFDFSKPNAISDFSKPEKLLAEKAAVRFFDMTKYSSIISTFRILELRFSFAININQRNLVFWKALLLEHLAHLELLVAKKNPEFEKNIYLPFLAYELDILKAQTHVAEKNHIIYHTLLKDKLLGDSIAGKLIKFTPIPHISEIPNIPESNSNYSQRLLPAQYSLDFNYNLDDNQNYYFPNELNYYLKARRSMLSDLVTVVSNRVNVYNRKKIFKYLPGDAQSKQAYDDWIELLELSTNPLLYDLLKLADAEPKYSTVLLNVPTTEKTTSSSVLEKLTKEKVKSTLRFLRSQQSKLSELSYTYNPKIGYYNNTIKQNMFDFAKEFRRIVLDDMKDALRNPNINNNHIEMLKQLDTGSSQLLSKSTVYGSPDLGGFQKLIYKITESMASVPNNVRASFFDLYSLDYPYQRSLKNYISKQLAQHDKNISAMRSYIDNVNVDPLRANFKSTSHQALEFADQSIKEGLRSQEKFFLQLFTSDSYSLPIYSVKTAKNHLDDIALSHHLFPLMPINESKMSDISWERINDLHKRYLEDPSQFKFKGTVNRVRPTKQ